MKGPESFEMSNSEYRKANGNDVEVVVAYTHNVSKPAIRVHKLPKPGETVRAIGYNSGIDGAKGTNCAYACSQHHVKTAIVAHVKSGDWFYHAEEILKAQGIDDRFILRDPEERPAGGCMLIDDEGNNIIVLSAENHQFIEKNLIDKALDYYQNAKYLVTGYELDKESVHLVLQSGKEHGVKTILNASPVPNEQPDDWNLVDIIVVNEVETELILKLKGIEIDSSKNPEQAAYFLRKVYGCNNVVITLGKNGFYCLDGENGFKENGINVKAVDTTGAGDGFLGAMTAELCLGNSLKDACSWANRYSSLTVQEHGTMSSYPIIESAEKQLCTDDQMSVVRK